MAPKKLTEADKKSILKLYREPEETTSTLADRFGVSNSTISRLLKASLPEKEYGRLIQQKRSTADKGGAASTPTKTEKKGKRSSSRSKRKAEPTSTSDPVEVETPAPASEPPKTETPTPASEPLKTGAPAPVLKQKDTPKPEPEPSPEPATSEKSAPVKRTRRRSKAEQKAEETAAQLELPTEDEPTKAETAAEVPAAAAKDLADDIDQEAEDIPTDWDDEDVSTLGDDYEDDDDDDDYDDEGETWDGDDEDTAPHLEKLEITPLTDASLPSMCYVVVERSSSELVALPLRTFAHLGDIPEAEGESRTLPVFDNHRVARRFSRRNQRVVKLPDGGLLQTTSPYLMAKGITRLLIDGQVFALEANGNGYDGDTDLD